METELKLKLNPSDLATLLGHPLLAGPSHSQRLLNTYFDTPELALQQRRMAVRERLAGVQWLLTVKTAGHTRAGLSRRQEWEGPTTPGELDFSALVDDATLAAELAALRPRLLPLFCTDFERQHWVLTVGADGATAQIEVALDQGRVHLPGTDLGQPLLELELELLSGPESVVLALADRLRQGPGGPLALAPSDLSKAELGMALWRSRA